MILTILKIIGIILLVILALVLVLLALVLFVPVAYSADGRKDDTVMRARADVTWLLRAVHVHVDFDANRETNLIKSITVFGIPVEKLKALLRKKEEKAKKARKKKLKKLKETDPETYEKLREEALERRRIEREKLKEQEEAEKAEAARKIEALKKKRLKFKKRTKLSMEVAVNAVRRSIRHMLTYLAEFYEDLFIVPGLIKLKIDEQLLNARKMLAMGRRWSCFALDPSTWRVVRLSLQVLRKLVKHSGPKKMSGHVTFGFDDPYQTGLVLAGAESLYPLWSRSLIVRPDFGGQKLEGDIELSGRIILSYVVYQGLRVLLNKDVKRAIAFVKQEKERANG